jgi:hypothetical protein
MERISYQGYLKYFTCYILIEYYFNIDLVMQLAKVLFLIEIRM